MQLMRKAEAAFLNSHIAPGVLADVIKSDIDQHAVLEKIADLFLCQEQGIKICQSGSLFDFFI